MQVGQQISDTMSDFTESFLFLHNKEPASIDGGSFS